jgi:polyhydroxybutyrate depolymerase
MNATEPIRLEWAPDGFVTEVRELDLWPGGELVYAMTATAPETVEFMNNAGMPLTTESRKTFTEVSEPTRLAYHSLIDFVHDKEPYEHLTVVELTPAGDGVSVVMTVEPLHDQVWTERLVAGGSNELDNLATVVKRKQGIARSLRAADARSSPREPHGTKERHEQRRSSMIRTTARPVHRRLRAARRVGVCAASLVAAVAAVAAAAPTAAAADAGCVRPDVAGDTTIDVRFAGASYPVELYVPDGARRTARLPLLLNLHASSTNGSIQMQVSGMRAVADEEHFIVAAPNGAIPLGPPPNGPHPNGNWAWNVPGVPLTPGQFPPPTARDDVGFLKRVIDVISRRFCTATPRTYATGFSGGGRMVSALACHSADTLTAIAPVAGLRAGRPAPDEPTVPELHDCRPERPLPVLTFHSQQDPVNPYLGNADLRWGYSVPLALQTWARLDGCQRGPQATPNGENVTHLTYTHCRDNVTVELYRIADGTHTWPTPHTPGATDELDASRTMWKFFERHRRTLTIATARNGRSVGEDSRAGEGGHRIQSRG